MRKHFCVVAVAAAMVAWLLPLGQAAIFVVTNISPSGAGSLQQAILDANASPGLDTITFQITGSGVHNITPGSPLPTITDPVVIDGTTQPFFTGTPQIELSGGGAINDGLVLKGGNSTIRGLAINGFAVSGIHVLLPGGTNYIQGNFIGTDPTGTALRGNARSGIWIETSPGNVIGGGDPTNRNVISGNGAVGQAGAGVFLQSCPGTVVQGNFIGLTATGTAALGNVNDGILVYNAPGSQVGGTASSARNVISGNGANGVHLYGAGSTGNLVQGNYIGTDASGAVALGNALDGLFLDSVANNTIGGAVAGSGNVICRNGHFGVDLVGAGPNNLVQGNFIGPDASGRAALGNGGSGVSLSNSSSNLIGGTVAQARNIVSGNGLIGIIITNSLGNTLAGNYVGTDVTGTNALGNNLTGIQIFGAISNLVGGASAAARNLISGNGGSGLEILAGASGNVVQANFIGTDLTGQRALNNRVDGVHVESGGNTIGGAVPGAGNLISGNINDGVYLVGATAAGNLIQGNYIGTDVNGVAAIPNQFSGVGISGAPGNTIGGIGSSAGNLISGNGALNTQGGIYLIGAGATGNLIQGNKIGTDSTGSSALSNTHEGIYASNAGGNTIGGTVPGAGNIISGNGSRGIFLNPGWGTAIQGNFIGVDATGTNALGNGHPILAAAVEMESGSHDNMVGGPSPEAGNRIGFAPDSRSGVRIREGATNNAILSNAIFSNAELGIDLGLGASGTFGVTVNDPCDVDTGANQLQNFPVLTQAVTGNGTGIRGTLNSTGSRSFVLQFFANTTCNPLGYGEGQIYLGQSSVVTSNNCNASFVASLPGLVPAGYSITATATDSANNTSEFSACIPVGPVPGLTIKPAINSMVSVAWTNTTTGFALKQTGSLSPPVQWSPVNNAPVLANGQFVVTLSPGTTNRFYVLHFE